MASSWTAMGKAPEEKIGLQDEQQEIRFTSFPKAFGFALKAPPTEPRKMNHGIVIQKPKLAPQSPPKDKLKWLWGDEFLQVATIIIKNADPVLLLVGGQLVLDKEREVTHTLQCLCKDALSTAPKLWCASAAAGFGPKLLDTSKCHARVWKQGWGYQCQHLKKQNSLYCWAHRSDECRPQGIYTQIPPAHKFPESPALLCSNCPIFPPQRKKPRRPAEKQEEHSTAEPASNAKGLFDLYYSMVVKSENLDDPLFEQLKSFVQFTAMTQTKQQEKQMAFMSTPLGETVDGSILAILFL